ncbi:MAG: class I SAM-dependent methyltransferase [Campylobacterota bacterium]|nr:class I SAM-dependent methyltransferase [Campylobacterota bacterium]
MSKELDIYAKSEHLLGIEESTEILHSIFVTLLEDEKINSVLDIGCGRGGLMKKLNALNIKTEGIDLSELMIEEALKSGLNVTCKNICEVRGTFKAATAVFDVLNFIPKNEIKSFFTCISNVLEEGGVFIADINSESGFSEVAEGVMCAEDEMMFLNVNAQYEEEKLYTEFTLFEKCNDGHYEKSQEIIEQYYYNLESLKNNGSLKLVEDHPLSLYDVDDKIILIFKKESKC